ncbi:Stk1 family PASTA domain-containing Ser/Thr kinase [Ornithinimicrobium sp. W1679]|uniref:Stk1 family PASTA domain-containing Ser/Thr kinase n=1 Tax=Ornithinimicrobium sp. W1679 TaxID=3418770 RepID=UPI003CEABE78
MSASTDNDHALGRVVDGRYRVEDVLAHGGMATVYRARDLRLDRPVALKVMRADLAADEQFVGRFVQEARTAARLSHPHVVPVYDQGEDDGLVFLAMELVEGATLRDVIADRAPLSPRAALRLLEPVVEALAAAHAAGLVHRDVKPENVLLGRGAHGGAVKVADFGLARLDVADAHTTEVLWGTAAYLAPEQVEQGRADPRTDVYAVGLLLFELLTGRKAFPGQDPLRVAYEHVHVGVPHLRDLVPTVPAGVEELVLRASATEPGDRPPDASWLLTELRSLRRSLTDEELDAVPVPPPPAGDATVPVAVDRHGARGRASGRTPAGPDDADQTQVMGLQPRETTRQIPTGGDRRGGSAAAPAEGHYARTTGNRTGRRTASPAPTGPPAPPARERRDAGATAYPPAGRGAPARRRGGAAAWVLALLLVVLGAGGAYGFWYLTEGPAVHSAMPAVVGLSEEQARTALDAEQLDPVVELDFSEDVPAGTVVSADAAPGAELRHGTDVRLVVSQGPERYAVPRLAGLTVDEATRALEEASLQLGARTGRFDETAPAGTVLETDPDVGTQQPPGTAVAVVVSDGPAPVDVPDVTGRTEQEARDALTGAGLVVEVSDERVFDDEVPDGAVVRQSPGPGAVERGSTVRLTLSQGPELVEVPDVVGRQFSSAEAELTELGLTVVREDVRGGFFGTVREQSVDPGTEVAPGTEVVLAVV